MCRSLPVSEAIIPLWCILKMWNPTPLCNMATLYDNLPHLVCLWLCVPVCVFLPTRCRSHDPVSVEPFIGRCFPGIRRLVVTKDWGVRIHALISPEGEKLTLRAPVELIVRAHNACVHMCMHV